jgi:hypothetical protein
MRLMVLALVILVLSFAGCMGGQQASEEQTTTSLSAPGSTLLTIRPTTSSTYSSNDNTEDSTTTTIRLPANITNCLTLDNITLRDYCFYDAAGKGKDMATCDKVMTKNLQLKCRARLEDNSAYCDEIDRWSEKDWCYWMMAFKWNKIKYCNVIFGQPIKDKCILDFVKDKKPDPLQCFQIVNPKMKDDCIYFHIDVYNRTGTGIKPNLCTLIGNVTLQHQCNETYLPKS